MKNFLPETGKIRGLFLLGFFLLLNVHLGFAQSAATVTTDKEDYVPGEYVIITGTGWLPGETVDFVFEETPKPESCVNSHDHSVEADLNGNIYYDQFLIKENHIGVSFVLTATGSTSGFEAQTTFTDGNLKIDTNSGSASISFIKYGAANCSGTILNSGSGNINTGTTNDTYQAVGENQSIKLTAPSTNNLGQTFSSWTSSNGTATFSIVGGDNKVICVEGTKNNGAIKLEVNYNISCTQPTVNSVNSCIGGGNVTFTQTGGNSGGTWSVSGGGTINSSGVFTPGTIAGCFTATYQTLNGNCQDTKSFVVFPAAPPAPTVNSGCGAITVTPPSSISGFNIQYSFDDGGTWGANNPPTADNCDGYKIRTRYTLAAACGSTAAGAVSTNSACAASPATNRVVDTTTPTADALADINVECFSDIPAADINDVTGETDNCDGLVTVAFVSDDTTSATCDGDAVTVIRTYSLTDSCGNTTNITQTINVDDVTPPTADALADINVECFSDIPAADINDVTGETDNCDGLVTVAFVSDDTTSATCDGDAVTVIRTYSLTDCSGNTTNITQTINVDDVTPPTADALADINVECFSDIPAADINDVTGETDNCDGLVTVAFVSDDTTSATCDGDAVTVIRTYSLTDCSGNTTNITQTINVDDVTPPTADALADINVECFSDIPAADINDVTGETDNCDGLVTVAFVSDDTTSATCDGDAVTVIRTYSLTDCSGNTTNITQTINVDDVTPPTADALADINVECFSDIPAADINDVTGETDNCDGLVTVAFVSDDTTSATCDGDAVTVIRTYSLTDCSGNTTNITQTINVDDVTPPTADALADINVECFSDIPAADINDVTGETDNCDGLVTVAFVSDDTTSATCDGDAVTVIRTYSLTDCSGNTTNITQTINVDDVTPPTADALADINVECFSDIPAADINDVTGETDNCDGLVTVAFVSDDTTSATCDGDAVTVIRTYSLTDCSGNTTNITQTINVDDVTPPTADALADINVECFSDIPAADINDVTGETDNCDGLVTVAFVSDDTTSATCDGDAVTVIRTYSLTDCSGNTTNITQTINVDDVTPPTADALADINVECFSDIPAADINDVTGETDNCDGLVTVAFVSDDTTSATCDGDAVTVIRTYSLTDCSGNTTNITQTINVDDVTPPTADALADINVECFSDIPAADINDVTGETDNCDGLVTVAFVSDDTTSATCDGDAVTVIRTYSLTDCSGNTTNITQTINVDDVTPPTADALADINVECFSDIPAADINDVTGETDNCDGLVTVAFVSDDTTSATCDGDAVTVIRTYSLTDCSGNTTNITQTINVDDVTPPTADALADINVECFSDIPAADINDVTGETDNCDGLVTVAFVSDDTTSATCDGDAVTVIRTYSLTDCSGNTTNITQTINVDDVTPPTADALADINVECFSDIPAADINDVTGETDNCDGLVTVAFVSDDTTSATCDGDAVTVIRTYSLTDCSGNTTNITQTINVDDVTPPTADALADINVECFSDIPAADINDVTGETDNCDGLVTVAFVSDDTTSATCDGDAVTVIRTYSLTDCSGNTTNITQTINVDDVTPPTADALADINVECFSDIPAADINDVTGETDNCDGLVTVAFVSDDTTSATCDGDAVTVIRTYSLTDCSGNTTNITQTINVDDVTPPTADALADINVECFSDIPAADINDVTGETDNCDGLVTVAFVSDDTTSATCDGDAVTVIRTYSLTDCSGNTTNITQTINVDDVTPPTADALADINVECFSDIPAADINDVTGETDNCDGLVTVAFVSDDTTSATCDGDAVTVIRTYSLTDCSGNTTNITQTINVDDVTPPTADALADINVECFSDIPAADINDVTGETDNCDGLVTVAFVSDDTTSATCDGDAVTVIRTYSLTDCSGNTTNITQTINVDDVTPPTADALADINVECFSDIPAADINDVTGETDNCDGLVTVAFVSDDTTSATCDGDAVTVIRTYSLTDCSGNTTNITQTINVDDVTPPTADALADINVECFSDIPAADINDVTGETDNCDGLVTVAFVSDDTTSATCDGDAVTVIRTYSLTDCSGNTTNITQTINVDDVTPPTADALADINVECFSDIPAADINDVTGETDNCDGLVTVAFVSDDTTSATCDGDAVTVIRTYSLTDCSGNTTNITQTINVDDVTPPTADALADINVECFSDIPAADINDVTGETDNCDGLVTVAFVSDDTTSATCDGDAVTVIRTYSLTDCSGNTTNITQTINVDDVTPPTADALADINVECFSDIPAADINDVTGETDNCDGLVTVAFVSDDTTSATCDGDAVTVIRTYSLTDCSGNTTNITQTINVDDVTPPTADALADINVECFSDIPAADINDVTGETDNCDGLVTVAFVSDDTTSATCDGDAVTVIRTYSLTDCSGNTTNITQTINVDDVTPPTADALADINVECFSDIPAADINDVTGETDNCDGLVTVAFVSDDTTSATCDGDAVTVIRTYSLTDCSGNTTNITQTINVDDVTPPTADALADINVECFSDIPAADINDVTGETDNCDGLVTVAFVSDDTTSATCDGDAVTVIRTYSLTDCSGNTTNITQTINVDDVTPPTADALADINVECFSDIPAADINDVTGETDNCDGLVTVAFVSDDTTSATCDGDAVTVIRTYSLTDCSGNTTNITQTINVDDVTPPTADALADINVECFSDIPAADINDVTGETDNCDGLVTVAFVSDDTTSATCDGDAVTVIRTYSLTDCSGNTTNITQTINVDDVTPPTADALADINVECFSDIPAADINDVTGETDNCDGLVTVAFVSDDTTSATCDGDAVTVIRTYSLTDCSGNTTNITQTINVDDVTPPTADALADINVECFSDIPAADINDVTGETDNCDGLVTVAFVSDDTTSATCDGDAVTVIRTYSLTDCSGNTTNITQTINVDDVTPPTGTSPFDITGLECIADVPVADIEALTDEADNCGGNVIVTVNDTNNGGAGCNGNPYIVTRTYTLTDCGGLTTVLVQTITVEDTTAPDLDPIQPLNPVAVNETFTIQAPSTGDNCSTITATWYFDPDGEITDPLDAPFNELGYVDGGYIKGTFDSSIFETTGNLTGTGVYSVMLVISDDCGNESVEEYDYLVIYDPSGGFVTGGGWFYSEPGNLHNTNNLPTNHEGKANFGFNAKYKSGKNNTHEVDGNTNFQFKEGDFHFKSSSHDDMSLVISGFKKATYRGRGTVNGNGDHKFMVTVIDGHATGGDGIDRFRIKIWDTGNSSTVLYDNERTNAENADASTEIGGGSIVIHKPKGKKTMETGDKSEAQHVEPEAAPQQLKTLEVAPNPMTVSCEIRFSLKARLKADLMIFDINGRQLRSLYSSVVDADELIQVRFDRGNLPSGVYICKLVTGDGHSYERQIVID